MANAIAFHCIAELLPRRAVVHPKSTGRCHWHFWPKHRADPHIAACSETVASTQSCCSWRQWRTANTDLNEASTHHNRRIHPVLGAKHGVINAPMDSIFPSRKGCGTWCHATWKRIKQVSQQARSVDQRVDARIDILCWLKQVKRTESRPKPRNPNLSQDNISSQNWCKGKSIGHTPIWG